MGFRKLLVAAPLLLTIGNILAYDYQITIKDIEIKPWKDVYKPGEEITVKVTVQIPDLPNNEMCYVNPLIPVLKVCLKEKIYVEAGIFPEKLAKEWFGPLTIFPLATHEVPYAECNPHQPNYAGKFLERWDYDPRSNPWEETFIFKLKVPYPEMRQADTYWAGEGKYWLVMYVTNGCYKDIASRGEYKVYAAEKLAVLNVRYPKPSGGGGGEIFPGTGGQNIPNIIKLLQDPIILTSLAIIAIAIGIMAAKSGRRQPYYYYPPPPPYWYYPPRR